MQAIHLTKYFEQSMPATSVATFHVIHVIFNVIISFLGEANIILMSHMVTEALHLTFLFISSQH
jgi:hypothetical protein